MKHWRIEHDDGLCLLTIDRADSRQNVLSSEVLGELDQVLAEITAAPPRGLVIRSGKSGGFIAGADVNEFSRVESEEQARAFVAMAHGLFDRIEALPFPTVALLNGHCLGGGLELALACDYRVALEDADIRIGLPEVLLGIHPGFGGTVRAIEACGVPAGMDMILSGRKLPPRAARKAGLVDFAMPERQLMATARHLVETRPPRRAAGGWKRWLGFGALRPPVAWTLERRVARRAKREHYPAPWAVIDLWRKHGGDRAAMLRAEQESVAKLVVTPTSRNLVKVFFLQEALKALGRGDDKDGNQDFHHVHVVGAGVMGGDIASWCALRGLRVTIQDANPEALGRATKRAHVLFQRKLRDERLVRLAMDRFQPDPAGQGASRAGVVIEAIFEDLEAKRGLFTHLEQIARPDALLATNTSSIPLEDLGDALEAPERLVGLHFFNPVAKMQLVEVVHGAATDDAVVARARRFAGVIGRLPLPVKSSPGFLVNRVLTPYLMEAVTLLREGVPAPLIDAAATRFGMPMGPVELADTVGLDICRHVALNLAAPGDTLPDILERKVAAGKLGRKTGEGFYRWKNGRPVREKSGADSGPADLEDRLILRYLNETVACIAGGIVDDENLAGGGLVYGTGYAPFRGGPVNDIIDRGQETLRRRLLELEQRHGARFSPHPGWTSLDLASAAASKLS